MKLLYIHGANSSGGSWNYIRERVKQPDLVLEYQSTVSFYANLKEMKRFVENDDWFLIGHSLGGIYAIHLWDHLRDRCRGGFTISAPYGGSTLADFARLLFPWFRLLSDVGVKSCPILEAQDIADRLSVSWTQIITTTGATPYISEKNDGVVSISSQLAHTANMNVVELPANHYEVLQDRRIVPLLKSSIERC